MSKLFISYSHENDAFVNKLFARLLEKRVAVWYDRVRIKVGESLLEKIQGAIQESDFLAVVLSEASVRSAWCNEELKAGLLRQLEERRVVVLPLLMEDCDIPLFLREKKYADFRKNFDGGFQELFEAIATVADQTLGRQDDDEYQTDHAIEWNIRDDRLVVEIDGVSFSKHQQYSVMTRIQMVGNDVATRRYRQYADAGLQEIGLACVLACCQGAFDTSEAYASLPDGKAMNLKSGIADRKTGYEFEVSFWARHIGNATGTSVLYHFGAIFGDILRSFTEAKPLLTSEQKRRLAKILSCPLG